MSLASCTNKRENTTRPSISTNNADVPPSPRLRLTVHWHLLSGVKPNKVCYRIFPYRKSHMLKSIVFILLFLTAATAAGQDLLPELSGRLREENADRIPERVEQIYQKSAENYSDR